MIEKETQQVVYENLNDLRNRHAKLTAEDWQKILPDWLRKEYKKERNSLFDNKYAVSINLYLQPWQMAFLLFFDEATGGCAFDYIRSMIENLSREVTMQSNIRFLENESKKASESLKLDESDTIEDRKG